MSRTHFRMNLNYIAVWMSRNSLLATGPIYEVLSGSNAIRTRKHLVRKRTLNHLAKLAIDPFNPVGLNPVAATTLTSRKVYWRCYTETTRIQDVPQKFINIE